MADFFAPGFDQQIEQQNIDRQRQYAQALRKQTMPEGRMVGRTYVAPSWTQGLAQMLNAYQGRESENMADEKQKALAAAVSGRQANEWGKIAPLLTGTQASEGMPANEMDSGSDMGAVKAQAPNLQGAYAAAMQSQDPALKQFGLSGMAQLPQLEARAEERQADRSFRQSEREAIAAQRAQDMQAQHAMRMDQLAQQGADRQRMAEEQRAFQMEMRKLQQATGASAQPYFQPVQTAQGVMAFNARTGKVEPVTAANGAPIIGAQADPTLQGNIAGAKSGATTEAKAKTEAKLMAPQAIAQADEAVKLVDDLLKAPGFGQAVGASRLMGIQKIPGTQAKDFDIRLDQLKGKQFLQAFESLKGGGQITEVEGKKATDAIARMDAAGSEAEFTKAAREFQGVIKAGAERAKAAAGGASPQAAPKARVKFDAQGNPIP